MAPQSLNMTSIWDDNYMILNSQYEKGNMNDDLANAIQEYVANTINKSNIGGENFFVSGDTSNTIFRENFQDSVRENTIAENEVNSISEYVSKRCRSFLVLRKLNYIGINALVLRMHPIATRPDYWNATPPSQFEEFDDAFFPEYVR